MSIRSVGVRQDTGAYHIIPRSSITTFANFVRGIGSVVANYDVDRHEDLDKASRALKAAVDDLLAREEIRGLIIGEPSFAGLVGLSNTAFTLRVSFTTLPLKQWTVRFALDTRVKSTSIAPGFARRYRLAAAADAGRRQPGRRVALEWTTAFGVVHKARAIKRLCFCPGPSPFHHFHCADLGQQAVERRQIIAARHQRGKPFHRRAKAWLSRIICEIKATSPLRTTAPAADRQN